jgi:hypothetical protein
VTLPPELREISIRVDSATVDVQIRENDSPEF